MKLSPRVVTELVVLLLAWPVLAQQPIFYPAKGQSQQHQQTDLGECQVWAKQNMGVDPVALAQQSGQPTVAPRQGGALRDRAALGAVGGAIGGDARKGAAIGAATRVHCAFVSDCQLTCTNSPGFQVLSNHGSSGP
jgi:hypothetical protein